MILMRSPMLYLMYMNEEANPSQAQTYYLLDLDRHLVDTIKLSNLLEETLAVTTDIPLTLMREARDRTEMTGGSFDEVAFLEPVLRNLNHPLERLMEDFIKLSRKHDVFESGARELLEMMKALELPFGILTYGGANWQVAKIRASQLDKIPYLVTPLRQKGEVIKKWQQTDRTFMMPQELYVDKVQRAQTVILLDDKASSFNGLPDEAFGVHVLPGDKEILPVQKGPVGPNVTVVTGLYEAAAYIKTYQDNYIDKA